MRDMEKLLKELPLTKAPETLDRRMGQLFSSAVPASRTRLFQRAIPLWQCAVGCALCVMAVLAFRLQVSQAPDRPAEPIRVVYIIRSGSATPGNVFDWTQYPESSMGATGGGRVVLIHDGVGSSSDDSV